MRYRRSKILASPEVNQSTSGLAGLRKHGLLVKHARYELRFSIRNRNIVQSNSVPSFRILATSLIFATSPEVARATLGLANLLKARFLRQYTSHELAFGM